MTAAAAPSFRTDPLGAPLPRRRPADPGDETERLRDWGLLASVMEALTADELEACHGTLVVHADGGVECVVSTGCPADRAMHQGAGLCTDLLGDCC